MGEGKGTRGRKLKLECVGLSGGRSRLAATKMERPQGLLATTITYYNFFTKNSSNRHDDILKIISRRLFYFCQDRFGKVTTNEKTLSPSVSAGDIQIL